MFKYFTIPFIMISTAFAFDNKPYIKFGGGFNQISPAHIKTTEHTGKIKLSHKFPLIELGAGLQITDTIRTELVYDYYFLFLSKEESTNTQGDVFSINYKTKINALTLNMYKDIITVGNFTPFVGGGVGISFMKDKASGYGTSSNSIEKLESAASKTANRFSYKLTTGVAINLTENTNLDISYNYLNLGSNRPRLTDGISNITKRDYLVHNLTASIRINL